MADLRPTRHGSASGWPARYEIRVAGVLDRRWAAWFDGLQVIGRGDDTVIRGQLADQPALHGLLTQVRDLGLCLISVRRLESEQQPSRNPTRHTPSGDAPPRPDPYRCEERHRPVGKERNTMTRMTPLLERNERFAGTYTPGPLALPTAGAVIVACLDHRVDPAIVLGLRLGDAPVIRNAGGRITQAVIDDIAYLAFLARQLTGGQGPDDRLFEVAVIHHTQCGTGFLADPGFRQQAAEATGLAEPALQATAVADPYASVEADVERLLTSPLLPPKVGVSGHVYDIATGRVTTTVAARYP